MDYSDPAELYSSASVRNMRGGRYMRFPSAAEAIRFAMEELPADILRGMAVEFGDERYEGEAIRGLYLAPGYPLARAGR